MVNKESVNEQLINLGFNVRSFANRAEIQELPNILIPDEVIFECVNGYYEGGFALLVATNIRVVLIDKKPLNFLTVEDLRFDMINQIDYSHRLLGAKISISVGSKNLNFRSYNKIRLRKLINHVQHCIADLKKQQSQHQAGQNQHLEQINQRLQAYLIAQYQNQQLLNQRLQDAQQYSRTPLPMPANQVVKPSPELADYLFAQSLLRQYELQSGAQEAITTNEAKQSLPEQYFDYQPAHPTADLYAAGRQEVFHKSQPSQLTQLTEPKDERSVPENDASSGSGFRGFEINPLRIAYAKLPAALRIKRRINSPQAFGNAQVLSSYPIPPSI